MGGMHIANGLRAVPSTKPNKLFAHVPRRLQLELLSLAYSVDPRVRLFKPSTGSKADESK
jgi:hypothetical protein